MTPLNSGMRTNPKVQPLLHVQAWLKLLVGTVEKDIYPPLEGGRYHLASRLDSALAAITEDEVRPRRREVPVEDEQSAWSQEITG